MNEIERAIDELTAQCGECSCLTDENTCTSDTDCFEAKRLAVISLREKLEREKGCEYCNNTDYIFESQQKIETPQWDEYEDGFIVIRQHINFCPMCGRRLEVKHD